MGKVVQRGDALEIQVELVDTANVSQLWGEKYSRKLTDLLTVQEQITKEIAEKLRLRVTGEEQKRLTKGYTRNTEAYQLYLQGRYYWHKGKDEAIIKMGEYFQEAVKKDPNYALGYAGLADYYALMGASGRMPTKETWPKSEAAAVKALAIDDTLGEAHHSLGAVKMWYDWDWPGAETEFKRAIALAPEFAEAYGLYARFLDAMGRFDEAIAVAKQSYEADPLSLHRRALPLGTFFLPRQTLRPGD
jgi:Tfp pilus assembly protein PilF